MSVTGTTRFAALLIGLLIAMGALMGAVPDPAAAAPSKYAALVIDADTGTILHQSHANERRYPASLTKMMTLYMAFDALKQGRWTLDHRLTVSSRAAAQPPSKLKLRTGRTIRVRDAILALVTKSANDVAVVLAEGLGGSESRFAALMTRKARALGMSRTTFRNASGLPDRGQVTTAHDMAILAVSLLRDFPRYYPYFATRTFSYGGASYRNHNGLLGRYNGVDGIKTGYIRASGFNLVASARRGGRRIIGVVFGGKTAKARNAHMVELLDQGFRSLKTTLTTDLKRPRIGIDVAAASAFPSTPTKLRSVGTWAIQVGAFSDPGPAQTEARRAWKQVRSLTEDAVVRIDPDRVGRKIVHQARIANVGREEAGRACRILKRKKFRCMIVKLKEPVVMARATVPSVFGRPSRKPPTLADGNLSYVNATTAGDGEQWAVQVGAFRDRAPALAMASRATSVADEVLKHGRVAVIPPTADDGPGYFLSQIHGLSQDQARAACARLGKKRIDCLVVELNGTDTDVDGNPGERIHVGWSPNARAGAGFAPGNKPERDGAGHEDMGGWSIQVGAFPGSKTARAVASKAVNVLPDTLQPGRIKVVPLSRKNRGTVYRARIVGIDRTTAHQACRLLQLKKFSCMVLRDKSPDLASAG